MSQNWLSKLLLTPQQLNDDAHHDRIASAVLLPIYCYQQQWQIILTRRSMLLKHHAGQFSFPGGRYEHSDQTLQYTALRESYEEIGLLPDKVTIISQLPNQNAGHHYVMAPFIGLLEQPFSLSANPEEVDEIIHLPLAPLLDCKNYQLLHITRAQQPQTLYFINIQGYVIWGATAAVLYRLANLKICH